MKALAHILNNNFQSLLRRNFAVKTKAEVIQLGPTSIVNGFLLAAVAALMFYYIVGANGIASSNYKIKLLSDKLTQLHEEQSSLIAEKAGLEESLVTLEYAKSHNMVEAKNTAYIFESKNVALQLSD